MSRWVISLSATIEPLPATKPDPKPTARTDPQKIPGHCTQGHHGPLTKLFWIRLPWMIAFVEASMPPPIP